MNDSSFPTAHDGDPLAAAGTGKSSRNLAATWTPVNLPPSPYFYGPLISSSSLSDDITDNDVQDEEELDLDLHGRKHVLIGPEQDGIYGMNGTALRSVKLADIQEKEVEKEFRDYITNFVPPEMITNDYGKVLPIDEFQPHELARLQAKLWVDIPRANAENRSPLGSLTREDTLMGAVIDLIAKKLAGAPHAFVIQQIRQKACNNPMCRKKFNHEYRLVVALEPLLNNASITTASHLKLYNGDILVFQRNNSLLQGKGLNIDLILANYSMVFCIECLQLLWDQRARVWLAAASVSDHRGIDRGLSAVSQTCSEDRGIVHNGFAAGEERGADVAADEAEGSVEGEGAQHNIVGVKHSPSATPRHGGQSGGVDSGADLELPVATADARSFTHNVPQLDGHVSDSSDEDSYQDSDQENINPQTLDNFPTTSNILHNLGPIMAANTTTWAPINKSDADSIDLDRTDGSSSGEDADYSDFEEHSSDIDRASSDVNHADTANTSQLHQQWDLPSWTAINQPSTTQPVVTIAEETTGASDEYWEFGEQDLLTDAVPFQGTFDRPRIPVTWPPPPLENRRTGVAFPGSPTADAVVESPGEQHGANLPWRPSRLEILQRVETALYGGPSELDELQRESTPLPASPIKTIFCPVAQSPVTPTNQETAPGATLADQRYAPSLCHCRRPAGTAKMAKCSNPKCHIQWYHYLCLSKGPKISYSRTRKTRAPWLCEVCKFKVRHPEAFDTVEHYVPANINFIRKSHIDSIVSDLGIPGRVGHIENPYGLASMQYCNRLRQVPREEESSSHTDTAEPVESEEESEEEHEEESNEEYALYPAPPDLEGDPFGFALVSRFVPRDDRSKRQKLNTVQELLQNNNPNRDGGCTSNVTDAKLIDHDSEDTVLGNDSSPAGNEETLVGPENTPTAKEMPEQKRKFDNSSSSHTDSSPLAKKGMGNRSDAFMSGALPPAEYAQHQHQDKSSRINRFEALMSGTAPSGAQDKGVEDVLMD